jgi:hypothetical protein
MAHLTVKVAFFLFSFQLNKTIQLIVPIKSERFWQKTKSKLQNIKTLLQITLHAHHSFMRNLYNTS